MTKYIDVEPLKAKIKSMAEEITRLLAENKKLKKENETLNIKCEQEFNRGGNEAWELTRKIILNNGYSIHDLYEIFDSHDSYHALENYTYQEAAERIAKWEEPCRRCARNCKDYWKADEKVAE